MEYLEKLWKIFTTPLFELSGNAISLNSLILASIVFILSAKLSKMVEKMLGEFLKGQSIDRGLRGTLQRLSRYLILLIGFFIALDTIGISLSSLAAIGAALMVGIGFGLQNITQNFISGLIILFERPIKIGDLVKVKGISGRIIEIGARSTLIHTRDDVAIIVPNSQFISEQVVNDSFSGERIRQYVNIGVAYGSDVDLVKKVLLKVAKDHPDVMSSPAPDVFFTGFGNSSLDFKLLVWISNIWIDERILSDLRYAIDKEFRQNQITIPFPQRDLHIKSGLNLTS